MEQNLGIAGPDLWKLWKRHEVNFRKTRTNMDQPENNPPFKSYEQAWRECFEVVFKEEDLGGDAAAAARRSVEHMGRRDPFPETIEALGMLQGKVRLSVFSNADDDFVRPLLKQHGLEFDVVYSSESAQIYKPHPWAYQRILDEMDLQPSQAWYVGDHLWDDVYGSGKIGMTSVWINRDHAEFDGLRRPDIEIHDLRELAPLLDETE
jgi:2-haloalkanoic acid dehalogenase type II